ncbi:MAG TPA: DUF1015 domain-containing protein [Flavobacteriales bacterium]|nr:DUF1015 domain-containing protein [Flavobacteriales bacterium]|tara:strand:+ start:18340 stop:19590 length:1251 start_codon:yes stop_codon:yes gene_type:complete
MAKVSPFCAWRPPIDKAHLVASRSFITYSQQDLIDKLKGNPFTFLHIINPEYEYQKKISSYQEKVVAIRKKYEEFIQKEYFIHDDKPALYIYRQIKNGNTYTGIIALTSIWDYFNGKIKKHEATLTKKEEKLKEYLKITKINAEPVCLTYDYNDAINAVMQKQMQQRPEYDFSTTDMVRHTLWLIQDKNDIDTVVKAFEEIDALYIADGHHRSASSSLLGKEMAEQNPHHNGNEGYNYFMSYLIDDKQLKIFDFNRIVQDLNGKSTVEFLEELKANFEIIPQKQLVKPKTVHEIAMYLRGAWYILKPHSTVINDKDVVKSLDCDILSEYILTPLLGIKDIKNDKRIDFISGEKGYDEMVKKVDSGEFSVAFGLYPVTMQQLKAVADANAIMPPKSTWVEPKLRSGLTVFDISDNCG